MLWIYNVYNFLSFIYTIDCVNLLKLVTPQYEITKANGIGITIIDFKPLGIIEKIFKRMTA